MQFVEPPATVIIRIQYQCPLDVVDIALYVQVRCQAEHVYEVGNLTRRWPFDQVAEPLA